MSNNAFVSSDVAISFYNFNPNQTIPFFRNSFHYGQYVQKLKSHTNTNFLVTTNTSKSYVCRLPRIDAKDHFQEQDIIYANACTAHHILCVAPLPCAFDPMSGCSVTEYVKGTAITLNDLQTKPKLLSLLIDTIRKMHVVSIKQATKHKLLPADVNTMPQELLSSKASNILWGYDLENLMDNTSWLSGKKVMLRARQFQELMHDALERFGTLVACHNDLNVNNFLYIQNQNKSKSKNQNENYNYNYNYNHNHNQNQKQDQNQSTTTSRVVIIDWECAGIGERLYDIGYFCAETEQDEDGQLTVLRMYLQREPSKLENAITTCWRTWRSLRLALAAKQSAISQHFCNRDISEIGAEDDYDDIADEQLSNFINLLSTWPMASTEFDSGCEEIVKQEVMKEKMKEKKIEMETSRLKRIEKRRRREKEEQGSDSD